jgi:hypothetical protein
MNLLSSTFYTDCIKKTSTQHVARGHLSATKCYVAREDIRNEKMSLKSFPDKAETERLSNLKTESQFIYGDAYYFVNPLRKNVLKMAHSSLCSESLIHA